MKTPDQSLGDLAKSFLSQDQQIADPITFIEAPWGLAVKLLPVQKVIIRMIYRLPLDRTPNTVKVPDVVNEKILHSFSEAEFVQWLYDEKRCNYYDIPDRPIREGVFSAGRRSGKTEMSSMIADYEIYKLLKRGDPSKYYGFPPQTNFSIINAAPSDGQSVEVFQKAHVRASRSPFLKDRMNAETATFFTMFTDEDIRTGKKHASLSFLTGSSSSNALRGKNAPVVILDEMAFFLDNGGRFSGTEVYKALAPSTANFKDDGKVICISSPYGRFGQFWKMYEEGMEEGAGSPRLCFKMWTALINGANVPSDYLKTERRRNRVTFMSEFGGEFSDSISAWADDPEEFMSCVTMKEPPQIGSLENEYFLGFDLGMKYDGSALSIVHADQEGIIHLDYSAVWYSGTSDVWDFEDSIYKPCDKYRSSTIIAATDMVEEIKNIDRLFPIRAGILDQHQGYVMSELLSNAGMPQVKSKDFNDSANDEVYKILKRLYTEKRLALYNHPVLVPEILTLEEVKQGGQIKIDTDFKGKSRVHKPNRRGAKDDISDSFARAVWLCYMSRREENPAGGNNVVGFRGGGLNAPTNALSYKVRQICAHGDHPRGVPMQRRRI